jgi:hypothetical protein
MVALCSPAVKPGIKADALCSPAVKPGIKADALCSPVVKPGIKADALCSPVVKPGIKADAQRTKHVIEEPARWKAAGAAAATITSVGVL